MDNNEPTIESLREEIAEKDAALAEMKAAADAQHAEAEKLGKLAEEAAEAGKVVAQEYENAKAEFAKQLAERDAEIASLKAAAKTAEQIAAEKYGAGTKPVAATPAGDPAAFKDRLKAAYGDASAMSRLVKERWKRATDN